MREFRYQTAQTTRTAHRTVVTEATNYSNAEIRELFQVGALKATFYTLKARRLFDLRLSVADGKYLLHEMNLSVSEIVRCYRELKLDVDLIRALSCTKDVLFNEISNIITKVGGVNYLRELTKKRLSFDNIKTLFLELKLSYSDAILLIDCGYKVNEIKTLIEGGITCSKLVELASAMEVSEVCSLFGENKYNLVFLSSVIDVLKRGVKNENSAIECHRTLYNSIPESLCQSLMTTSIPSPENNATYEDILIHYMDLAGGKIPMAIGIADAVPKVFIMLRKVIKAFRRPCLDFIDDYIPVKPFILAAIWFSLDMSLAKQYFNNNTSVNAEVVGRSILSFLISSMCGVTGYFHSGGAGLPFPNITSYIRTYFNIQHSIKDRAPKVYEKIPKRLLLNSNQDFERLTKEKQISAGQGLSMVYTFRVGNAFLCSLIGRHVVSFESAENIFKSLWPLPEKAESTRMYFIYSGIPIYSKLNLEDVFVSIS